MVEGCGLGSRGHDRGKSFGVKIELLRFRSVGVGGSDIRYVNLASGEIVGDIAGTVIDSEPVESATLIGKKIIVKRTLRVVCSRRADRKSEIIREGLGTNIYCAAGKITRLIGGKALCGDNIVEQTGGEEVHRHWEARPR